MATQKRQRRVKIYGKYRSGGMRLCDPDPREVPWLNVSGDWLKQAGFEIGDRIQITVGEKELHIKNCGHGDGDCKIMSAIKQKLGNCGVQTVCK